MIGVQKYIFGTVSISLLILCMYLMQFPVRINITTKVYIMQNPQKTSHSVIHTHTYPRRSKNKKIIQFPHITHLQSVSLYVFYTYCQRQKRQDKT